MLRSLVWLWLAAVRGVLQLPELPNVAFPCDHAWTTALRLSWDIEVSFPINMTGFESRAELQSGIVQLAAATCKREVEKRALQIDITVSGCTSELATLAMVDVANHCDMGAWTPTVYYINLQRRPERDQHMRHQLARLPEGRFTAHRVQAIDGASHEFTREQVAMFDDSYFAYFNKSGNVRRPGLETPHPDVSGILHRLPAMANALSHYGIWQRVARGSDPFAIVMQDDALLSHAFADDFGKLLDELPRDAWVVWLSLHNVVRNPSGRGPAHLVGFPIDSVYDPDTYSTSPKHTSRIGNCIPLYCNPCSGQYLLTRAGARQLVAHAESSGFNRATDIWMNQLLIQHGKHYIARPLLGTVATQFGSDIFSVEVRNV